MSISTSEVIYFYSSLGGGSIVEPFSVVPLNDELQQARASVTKAETDVLSMLTSKVFYFCIYFLYLFGDISIYFE